MVLDGCVEKTCWIIFVWLFDFSWSNMIKYFSNAGDVRRIKDTVKVLAAGPSLWTCCGHPYAVPCWHQNPYGISWNPLGNQTWHWNMENHPFVNDLLAVFLPLVGGVAGGLLIPIAHANRKMLKYSVPSIPQCGMTLGNIIQDTFFFAPYGRLDPSCGRWAESLRPWTRGELIPLHKGVSENSVPLNPMVNDHYPY